MPGEFTVVGTHSTLPTAQGLIAAGSTAGRPTGVQLVVVDGLLILYVLSMLAFVLLLLIGSFRRDKDLWFRRRQRRTRESNWLAEQRAVVELTEPPDDAVVLLAAQARRWRNYQLELVLLGWTWSVCLALAGALALPGSGPSSPRVLAGLAVGTIVTAIFGYYGSLFTQLTNPRLDCARAAMRVLLAADDQRSRASVEHARAVLSAVTQLAATLPTRALRIYLEFPLPALQEAAVARFSRRASELTTATLTFDADTDDKASLTELTRLALEVLEEVSWQRHDPAVDPLPVGFVERLRQHEVRLRRLMYVAPVLTGLGIVAIGVAGDALGRDHGHHLPDFWNDLATGLKVLGAVLTLGRLGWLGWQRLAHRAGVPELEAAAHDLVTEAAELARDARPSRTAEAPPDAQSTLVTSNPTNRH